MNELKPCPFCGEKHPVIMDDYGWGIQKPNVNIECLIGNHDQEVHIELEVWNKWCDTDLLRRIKEAVEDMNKMKHNIAASCYDDIHIPICLVQGIDNSINEIKKHIPELEAQDDTD